MFLRASFHCIRLMGYCSRLLFLPSFSVLLRVRDYLKEREQKLILEIAEKNRENAENQAAADYYKARIKQ